MALRRAEATGSSPVADSNQRSNIPIVLALDDPRWANLSTAYGPAVDLPNLLTLAAEDFRPGHEEQSNWFALWSALCHQGDVYTASYAALPHLVGLATERLQRRHHDPLHLAASIELSRLEGRGPAVPEDLIASYYQAVEVGRRLAERSVSAAWDRESERVILGSLAAFSGDIASALAILDPDE